MIKTTHQNQSSEPSNTSIHQNNTSNQNHPSKPPIKATNVCLNSPSVFLNSLGVVALLQRGHRDAEFAQLAVEGRVERELLTKTAPQGSRQQQKHSIEARRQQHDGK